MDGFFKKLLVNILEENHTGLLKFQYLGFGHFSHTPNYTPAEYLKPFTINF